MWSSEDNLGCAVCLCSGPSSTGILGSMETNDRPIHVCSERALRVSGSDSFENSSSIREQV